MNAKNKKAIPISIGMAVAVVMIVSIFAVAIPGIASEPLNVTMKEPEQEPEKTEIEIEKLQQWVYDQGYNYTVAENWITALSPEERQSLCGYKPLTPPAGPLLLPENVKFQSKSMVEIHESERNGQPPVGQPPAYDAMALGYVTPVKNQGGCGSCWIFGATAEFESDILINENVSNLTLNFAEQEVGDCNIWSSVGGYNFCNGGNELMTTNYFTKHGSANESCHLYAAASQTCLNCPIHKNVDNWRMITESNGDDLGQVNTIKNAILNYGPVYSTIYAGGPFGSYYDGVYEYWGPQGVNHAIEIIGWDDSLPHSHGTGAWLIKNSWGTGWGAYGPYPGCAWVAYGAANLGDYTSAITSYKNPGDVLFYHDECGWMEWCLGYNNPTAYGAVRFTPFQNATLTAVDFWAVDPSMTYEIKIFDTLNGGPTYYTFSNQLGTTQTGSTTEMGYYSIPLDTPVQLINGDDFIVLVKLTTTTGWGSPLPIDYYDATSHPWNPPLPQVFTFSGESYKSPDGSQFVKPTVDIGIRARALSGEPDLNITDKFETWLNMTHYNITYTVKNIGDVNATIVSRTNVTIDGSQIETDTLPALNVNETHTATFGPFEMSDDNDTIKICADIYDNVTEYNEFDNCLENTLHKSTTIEVNTSGWGVSPVEGDLAEGEFHSSTTTPIQDAIDNATAGCTIIVEDGTYSENIVVNQELTIKAASIPIVNGLYSLTNPAFNITVNNVTVQGFIVQNFIAKGADAAGDTGAILVAGNNATVVSNIVRNINCTGTEGACPAGLGIDVHANDVEITNNQVYNISSTGIRVRHDWNTPPTVSNNILVENNTVNATGNSSILVTGYAKGVTIRNNEIYESLEPMPYNLFVHYGASDVTIGGEGKGNYIHDAYANLVLAGCNNVTIKDNVIEDATSLPSDSSVKGKNIYVLNDYRPWYDVNALSTNITIESNNICNAEGWGVRIRNIGATGPSRIATTTTINWNNIVGNTEYGVENVNISATVNATHNWWGDPCGPGPVPGGRGNGDNVSANVTYSPWLDAPYPVGEPVESCARVYFEPQNSSAIYCNTKDVEIWVNATGYFQSGQINLTYNSSCANVTDWALNTANFGFGGGWTHKNGSDRISFARNTSQTGKYMLGTLTIHCVSGSEKGCNTTLRFGDGSSELFGDYGKTLPVEWINGTFSCEEILCGDVNCDGDKNIGDATLTLNHWTSAGTYLLCSDWAGDVNCDYAINVGDATLILNHWLNPGAYPLNCCMV